MNGKDDESPSDVAAVARQRYTGTTLPIYRS